MRNLVDVQNTVQRRLAVHSIAGGVVIHPDDLCLQPLQVLRQPHSLQRMVLILLRMHRQ